MRLMLKLFVIGLLLSILFCTKASVEDDFHLYVRVGVSSTFKVDQDGSVTASRIPAKTLQVLEVRAIVGTQATREISQKMAQSGCKRGGTPEWRQIPIENTFEQDAQHRPVDLVVADGLLVDVVGNRFLDGICPGSITHATSNAEHLLVSRKEILGSVKRQGQTVGFRYSGSEIVSLGDVGREMSTVLRVYGRVRALAVVPGSGQLIVIRETSVRPGSGGWLRALSGHPRQASTYDIEILDSKEGQRRVATLLASGPGLPIELWM